MLIWNKALENAITEDALEMIQYLHTDCILNVISVHTVMTQETSSDPDKTEIGLLIGSSAFHRDHGS